MLPGPHREREGSGRCGDVAAAVATGGFHVNVPCCTVRASEERYTNKQSVGLVGVIKLKGRWKEIKVKRLL